MPQNKGHIHNERKGVRGSERGFSRVISGTPPLLPDKVAMAKSAEQHIGREPALVNGV